MKYDDTPNLKKFSKKLQAVGSHELRFRILELLSASPLSVDTICQRLHAKQPTVSRHLRHLLDADLVRYERFHRVHRYSAQAEQLAAFIDDLADHLHVNVK